MSRRAPHTQLGKPGLARRAESPAPPAHDHDHADDLRTLIALLRPPSASLARRLVEALMLAPEQDRAAIVARVESELRARYRPEERLLHVAEPPVQRDGYVEQVVRTYAVVDDAPAPARPADPPAQRAG